MVRHDAVGEHYSDALFDLKLRSFVVHRGASSTASRKVCEPRLAPILHRLQTVDMDDIDSGLSQSLRIILDQVVMFAVALLTIVYGIPPFVIAAIGLGYLHWYIGYGVSDIPCSFLAF